MDKMRKVLRLPPLQFQHEYFLFLLPLFFVFHGYNEYYGKVTIIDGWLLLLEYLATISAVALLFFLLYGSFRKAALYTTALFCFHFFFGASHDWLKEAWPGSFVARYSFILPSVLLVFVLLYRYLKRSCRLFGRTVKYLNVLFLCLLFAESVSAFFKETPHQDIVRQATIDNRIAPLLSVCDTCVKEDIHLIVLDEYAGAEQLKDVFGFDNRPFADTLRARGFRVLEGARSNYNYSPISMASMLSLDYLSGLGKWPHYVLMDIANPIIEQNVFTDFLSRQGYVVNNISIFDLEAEPAYEHHFKPGGRVIRNHTFLNRLVNDLGYHLLTTLSWKWAINSVAEGMEKEAAKNTHRIDTVLQRVKQNGGKQAQFYYTHLMMPHQPFVLDRNGNSVGFSYYLDPDRTRGFKRGYLEYLQYANKKVVSFIDTLVKISPRPPIILLMGDHGFRHPTVPERYHLMTLNAVYFPDGRYDGYYNGLTHVNQLRLLLNNRFGQRLPLAKDSTAFLGWPGM
jgi:hypothetical protein